MTYTLGRLGLAMMLYAVLINRWDNLPTTLVCHALAFVGGLLFIIGPSIERFMRTRFPNFPW